MLSGFCWALVIVSGLVALHLSLNLPIRFDHHAVHDAGMFMQRADHLESGRWMGPFDQFTLAKGPGYPLFLAVTSFFGIPVQAAHFGLQLLALSAISWLIVRLTGSRVAAAAVFAVLALHPVSYLPAVRGVIRDQIYWSQSVLVFVAFAAVLFVPMQRSRQLARAAAAGLLLAWTWLTREEGVWLLPGLALIGAGALIRVRRHWPDLLQCALAILVAGAGFTAGNLAYAGANFAVYGSFVAVDFKESNFKRALSSLQSIDTGPATPYLPVPNQARMRVAEISQTFRPIAQALLPGAPLSLWARWGDALWGDASCKDDPSTCGDIRGGWFVWALRDAAAVPGITQRLRRPPRALRGSPTISGRPATTGS